jgi:hypothetical protein
MKVVPWNLKEVVFRNTVEGFALPNPTGFGIGKPS